METILKLLFIFIFIFVSTGISQEDTTVVDSVLLKQLEQQMAIPAQSPTQQAVTRTSPTLNPDISAIGDFRSSYTSLEKRSLELYLNELEIQLASIVDPYARAEFVMSFGKDLRTGDHDIELEVATLTSLSLPNNLQITLGKFKPQFGKVNILHPHYFSYIDFPRMVTNFFESEGMFMEGISASWLVPNPYDFYQELIVEVGRASSEANAAVVPGGDNRLLYIGRLKSFFDLTENATLELGFSGLTGPNRFNFSTNIAGIDLTYKWKPLQFNTYKSFTWQSEVLLSGFKLTDSDVIRSYGGYSYTEYQFEKRWFMGLRYDHSGFPDIEKLNEQSGTLLFRFQPTEFQILALQYQYVVRNYDENFSHIALRFIFGIGKHGAHTY